jgi:hypothetical protein
VINSLNLREIVLSVRQFTWANNLPTPTFEKLDRILTSTDWELKYTRVRARALPRILSDHTPLLLDTGIPSQPNLQRFKVELSWLFKDDFYEVVARTWRSEKRGSNAIEIW